MPWYYSQRPRGWAEISKATYKARLRTDTLRDLPHSPGQREANRHTQCQGKRIALCSFRRGTAKSQGKRLGQKCRLGPAVSPTTCGQLQSPGNPGPQGAAVASLSRYSSIAIILTQPQTGILSVSPRSDVQKEERKHRTGSACLSLVLLGWGSSWFGQEHSPRKRRPAETQWFHTSRVLFLGLSLFSGGNSQCPIICLPQGTTSPWDMPFTLSKTIYSYKLVHSTVFYNYLLTIWPWPGNVPGFTPTTS